MKSPIRITAVQENKTIAINNYFELFEKIFSIVSIVFYSSSILFLIKFDYGIIGALERTTYHLLTLVTLSLIAIHWRKLVILKNEWLLVSLIVFACSSVFWSDLPSITTALCLPLIRLSLLGMFMAIRFDLDEYVSILATSFTICVLLSLFFCLVLPHYGVMGQGIILSGEDIKHAGSWRGIYSHKNYLGRSMALASLVLLFTEDQYGKKKFFNYVSLGLSVLILFLSHSKTSLIVFMTLMVLVPLFTVLRLRYTWTVPILAFFILTTGSFFTVLYDNIDVVFGALGKDATLSGRTKLWQSILLSIQERPLLGHGYGAFWPEHGSASIIWQEFGWEAPHAHNGLLDMAVEIGVLGTAIFVVNYVAAVLQSISLVRQSKKLSGIFPISFLILMFMVNLTESSTVVRPQFAWLIFVSTVLLVHKERRNLSHSLEKEKFLRKELKPSA